MSRQQKPGDPGVWSVYAHCDNLAPVTLSLDSVHSDVTWGLAISAHTLKRPDSGS